MTPDATTTAALAAAGLTAGTLTTFISYLAQLGVSIGIYLIEVLAPYWMILVVISAVIGVATSFLFVWGRHGHKR